jgi:hypothetical protein
MIRQLELDLKSPSFNRRHKAFKMIQKLRRQGVIDDPTKDQIMSTQTMAGRMLGGAYMGGGGGW